MLLQRSQLVIGLISMLVLGFGAVFGVLATAGILVPGQDVSARFTDAAGVGRGAFVLVAGVRVGEVRGVEIEGETVRVDLRVDTDVPDDSTASIILQNALGKRAISIAPGTSTRMLAAGDEIPVERTFTPVDFPELGDETVELLGETDVDALNLLASALADIADGAHDDVADLLDGVERLTRLVSDRRDELAQVIDRATVMVDAFADRDHEIVRIIDAFGSTLDRLATRRTDVQRLLRETALATGIAADLVSDKRAVLDRSLAELHEILDIVDANQVDVAHFLAYAGVSVDGFAGVGYHGGPAKLDNPSWANMFTTGLGLAGVDALLGCGGALDQILTGILGADPDCDGTIETGDEFGPSGGGNAFRTFFGGLAAGGAA